MPSIFRVKEGSVLKMEAACHFETLTHIYKVPPRHIRQERSYTGIKCRPFLTSVLSVMSVSIAVLFGLVWSGLVVRSCVFVILNFFPCCTIYSVPCCTPFYPFLTCASSYPAPFLPCASPYPAPFLPCVSHPAPLPAFCILSGTVSYLCISSGTPSCLVHLLIRHPFLPVHLIRHPFLPCASPYPAPFLPCVSHLAPLPAFCISLSGTLSYLCISSGTPSCLVHLLFRHPFLSVHLIRHPSCLVHLPVRHPLLLVHLLIRHPFLSMHLLIRHPIPPCAAPYPAPLSSPPVIPFIMSLFHQNSG